MRPVSSSFFLTVAKLQLNNFDFYITIFSPPLTLVSDFKGLWNIYLAIKSSGLFSHFLRNSLLRYQHLGTCPNTTMSQVLPDFQFSCSLCCGYATAHRHFLLADAFDGNAMAKEKKKKKRNQFKMYCASLIIIRFAHVEI